MHERVARGIDYIGIDETTAGPSWDSFIVVAAETQDPALARRSSGTLWKARDYLADARARRAELALPSFEDLRRVGLSTFYWARARPGRRFTRPQIEHGVIPHVITHNGYRPESTVVIVDAFQTNYAYSQELLYECFHAQGFRIPRKNIEVVGEADTSVPIVNFADLLAFQVGVAFGRAQRARTNPDVYIAAEVPFDHRRSLPLPPEGRDALARVLTRR